MHQGLVRRTDEGVDLDLVMFAIEREALNLTHRYAAVGDLRAPDHGTQFIGTQRERASRRVGDDGRRIVQPLEVTLRVAVTWIHFYVGAGQQCRQPGDAAKTDAWSHDTE